LAGWFSLDFGDEVFLGFVGLGFVGFWKSGFLRICFFGFRRIWWSLAFRGSGSLVFPDISFLQYKDAKRLGPPITYSMRPFISSIFGQISQISRFMNELPVAMG
jgi:hypothetical protein